VQTKKHIITITTTTTTTIIIIIIIIIIDIAVPLSHNIQNVYAQKINKYTELATKIQQMWNVQKINIRPMVILVTGIVSQHLKTQLRN
jgi:hypothetical protein